jgi:hypothetical protein
LPGEFVGTVDGGLRTSYGSGECGFELFAVHRGFDTPIS